MKIWYIIAVVVVGVLCMGYAGNGGGMGNKSFRTVIVPDDGKKKLMLTWRKSRGNSVAGYRVYYDDAGEVDYDSDSLDVGDKTWVDLRTLSPDLDGTWSLGVVAVHDNGDNESDMLFATNVVFATVTTHYLSQSTLTTPWNNQVE